MKDFIPYEEALELNKLGFELDKDSVFGYWNLIEYDTEWTFDTRIHMYSVDYIIAPLYQQAFRSFREKYGLNHEIPYAGREGEYHAFVQNYIYGNNRNSPSVFTYEEAELECLKKLIQIVKQ